MSDYDDEGKAKLHLNAVKTDKYAAIIDLQKPAHLNKIREVMQEGSAFILYWAVVKSAAQLEKTITGQYKDHMRRYITKNLDWRISGDSILRPSLQISFGELFVTLKHAAQTVRIKFEEIEQS